MNLAEQYMHNLETVWPNLQSLMEKIRADLRAGRQVTHADSEDVRLSTNEILHDLQMLQFPEPMSQLSPKDVAPIPRDTRSAFQKLIDDMLLEYTKIHNFELETLKGPTKSYKFTYDTVEKSYRSGAAEVEIPVALLELAGKTFDDSNLMEHIKNTIIGEGIYEYISTEEYDLDGMSSDFGYEEQ